MNKRNIFVSIFVQEMNLSFNMTQVLTDFIKTHCDIESYHIFWKNFISMKLIKMLIFPPSPH